MQTRALAANTAVPGEREVGCTVLTTGRSQLPRAKCGRGRWAEESTVLCYEDGAVCVLRQRIMHHISLGKAESESHNVSQIMMEEVKTEPFSFTQFCSKRLNLFFRGNKFPQFPGSPIHLYPQTTLSAWGPTHFSRARSLLSLGGTFCSFQAPFSPLILMLKSLSSC